MPRQSRQAPNLRGKPSVRTRRFNLEVGIDESALGRGQAIASVTLHWFVATTADKMVASGYNTVG